MMQTPVNATALPPSPDPTYTQGSAVPLGQVKANDAEGTSVEVDEDMDHQLEFPSDSEGYSINSSAAASTISSIFNFTYANGRRYHSDRFKSAHYFLPNDEREQERLDLYHHIWLSLLGGQLYTAPLNWWEGLESDLAPTGTGAGRKVLDVGTGTGIWALDFAEEFPAASVIGTDLSPIQPAWVPPNCTFEIEDMEEEWPYDDNYFDFIHIRSLSGSFRNWDKALEQTYAKLVPGGYIEFQDYDCQVRLSDGTPLTALSEGHPISTYFYHVLNAASQCGRPLDIAAGMRARLEKAGFVDVVEQRAVWPLGDWPKDKRLKELGKWGRIGAVESTFPFAVQLLTGVGWSRKEVENLCNQVVQSLYRNKYYCYG
ncbi:S-adenosyl-L-methionine-dependent methyltransferase [Kalaharituber pfeilii]|nr:S-adenosyl-L-methionine-dependent methyltransferase [Kalaharituber pfeilii]